MKSEKRLKTSISDNSRLDLHKKTAYQNAKMKTSIHLKSTQKQITPKKYTNKSKQFQTSKQKSSMGRSKHLQSVNSLNGDKYNILSTKRKQSRTDMETKIRNKIENFKVLSNCLKEFAKEQKKFGKELNKEQILHLIKAFNKSEIGPVSKQIQQLINNILESIEDTLYTSSQVQGEEQEKKWEENQNDLEHMNEELIQLKNVGRKLKGEILKKSDKNSNRLKTEKEISDHSD